MNNYKIVTPINKGRELALFGFYEDEESAKERIEELKKSDFKVLHRSMIMPIDIEKIDTPIESDYSHYICSKIPREEMERVLKSDASAEIGVDFITCSSQMYYYLSRLIPLDWNVIDIGCGYNAQSYLFQQHARHIAIEPSRPSRKWEVEFFNAPNTEMFNMTGQEFIMSILPTLHLNLSKTFAICNYVPSKEATEMVRNTFPNCYCMYPCV